MPFAASETPGSEVDRGVDGRESSARGRDLKLEGLARRERGHTGSIHRDGFEAVNRGEALDGEGRRRSFRGVVLDGTDFAEEDLRGVDLSGASLRSASFRGARLGVRPWVGAALLGVALMIAVAAGAAIGWSVDGTRERLLSGAWDERAGAGTVAFLLVFLVALVFWRGFDLAVRVVAVAYVVLLVLNVVANAIWDEVELGAAGRATLVVVFLVMAVGAGILGRLISGFFGAWAIAVVALLGGLASGRAHGGVSAIIVGTCLVVISKRALRGDERDRTLRLAAHRLVRRWGTRFADADLTGADFTGVDAIQCDLTGATLAEVRWDPAHPPVIYHQGDRSS